MRTALPRLNGDVLGGRRSPQDLLAAMNAAIPSLESPARGDLDDCRRRLVVLGMIGSSAERHSQEAGSRPGQALAALRVGRWSFRRYVATLASRVGGPPRDSFRSFILWNGEDVHVCLPGTSEAFSRLPGVLPRASGPLTFSDNAGEPIFIDLMRRCVAMEAAANSLLWPACDRSLEVDDPQALDRVGAATLLLRGLRAEMNGFRQRQEFTAAFFLDTLRQYACPWEPDEISSAPSGAHDVEYVVRDLLLGTPITGHDDHVDDLFHVLDGPSQALVHRARATGPLHDRLGARLGTDLGQLPEMVSGQLTSLVGANRGSFPTTTCTRQNGEVSASHWAMVYGYMIAPMRARDHDAVVVSNHEGTGHLRMEEIRAFMTDRCRHVLSPLQPVLRARSVGDPR